MSNSAHVGMLDDALLLMDTEEDEDDPLLLVSPDRTKKKKRLNHGSAVSSPLIQISQRELTLGADEFVDTSDLDEREEISSFRDDYWHAAGSTYHHHASGSVVAGCSATFTHEHPSPVVADGLSTDDHAMDITSSPALMAVEPRSFPRASSSPTDKDSTEVPVISTPYLNDRIDDGDFRTPSPLIHGNTPLPLNASPASSDLTDLAEENLDAQEIRTPSPHLPQPPSQHEPIPTVDAGGRTLRQRNQMQLKPYTMERAQYEYILKRGRAKDALVKDTGRQPQILSGDEGRGEDQRSDGEDSSSSTDEYHYRPRFLGHTLPRRSAADGQPTFTRHSKADAISREIPELESLDSVKRPPNKRKRRLEKTIDNPPAASGDAALHNKDVADERLSRLFDTFGTGLSDDDGVAPITLHARPRPRTPPPRSSSQTVATEARDDSPAIDLDSSGSESFSHRLTTRARSRVPQRQHRSPDDAPRASTSRAGPSRSKSNNNANSRTYAARGQKRRRRRSIFNSDEGPASEDASTSSSEKDEQRSRSRATERGAKRPAKKAPRNSEWMPKRHANRRERNIVDVSDMLAAFGSDISDDDNLFPEAPDILTLPSSPLPSSSTATVVSGPKRIERAPIVISDSSEAESEPPNARYPIFRKRTAMGVRPPTTVKRTHNHHRPGKARNKGFTTHRREDIRDHLILAAPRPNEIEHIEPPRRQSGVEDDPLNSITLDFDIPNIPVGTSLDSWYLRGTRLHELIQSTSAPGGAPPITYEALDVRFHPALTAADYLDLLPCLCDRLFDWASGGIDDDNDPTKPVDHLMLHGPRYLSWLLINATMEDSVALGSVVRNQLHSLTAKMDDWIDSHSTMDKRLGFRSLSVRWFAIELSHRAASAYKFRQLQDEATSFGFHADMTIKTMFRRLLKIGFSAVAEALQRSRDEAGIEIVSSRPVEFWISMIHFLPSTVDINQEVDASTVFWTKLKAAMDDEATRPDSELKRAEWTWHSLFMLSTLSRFSLMGTMTSTFRLRNGWDLATAAMRCVRLGNDEKQDVSSTSVMMSKRSRYFRLIMSRCFILATDWDWKLDNAESLFRQLCDVFRSRNFTNLDREKAAFPPFIDDRHAPKELLLAYNHKDTAFEVFLKLLAKASEDVHREEPVSPAAMKLLRKLLSMATPVSAAQFSKDNPPTTSEISMLINRFSGIIMAVRLDPTIASARNKISQAKRFINFPNADWKSRELCIRAMMYLAAEQAESRLDLTDIIDWVSQMTSSLISELHAAEAGLKTENRARAYEQQSKTIITIHLLLESLRLVVNDHVKRSAVYPDPRLLQEVWLAQLFQSSVIENKRAADSIRKYIQVFLESRQVALPPARHLAPPAVPQEESQEEYGDFNIDLDDPQLLAVLEGPPVEPPVDSHRERDKQVANSISSTLSPALYKLVSKHFTPDSGALRIPDLDEAWIDCWVGCAYVLVQNELRDWSAYFQWGPESWSRLIDAHSRRRVGLRFMLAVLKLDPMAYKAYKDNFLTIWLETVIATDLTIQDQYTSALFSVDGLRHPLFRNIGLIPGDDGNILCSLADVQLSRLSWIQTIASNLSASIASHGNNPTTKLMNEAAKTSLIGMISAMKDNYERIEQDERKPRYRKFCREVRQRVGIVGDVRLKGAGDWIDALPFEDP